MHRRQTKYGDILTVQSSTNESFVKAVKSDHVMQ